jgi:hypothetical protein
VLGSAAPPPAPIPNQLKPDVEVPACIECSRASSSPAYLDGPADAAAKVAFTAACRWKDAHQQNRVRPAAPISRDRQRPRASSVQRPCRRWFRLYISRARARKSIASARSLISAIAKLAVFAGKTCMLGLALTGSTTREPGSGLSGQMPPRPARCRRGRASGFLRACQFLRPGRHEKSQRSKEASTTTLPSACACRRAPTCPATPCWARA